VIRNHPLDVNGDPFPTTFWLTCPDAVKSVSRVESGGAIARFNERIQDDEAFDASLEAAHAAYAEERGSMLPEARGWGGVGRRSCGAGRCIFVEAGPVTWRDCRRRLTVRFSLCADH